MELDLPQPVYIHEYQQSQKKSFYIKILHIKNST